MELIIKQIIIIVITFLVILWFQYNDDMKHKRTRIGIFDKIKLPLLVCTMVALILNLSLLFNKTTNIINVEIDDCVKGGELNNVPPNLGSKNMKDILDNLEISIELPDF